MFGLLLIRILDLTGFQYIRDFPAFKLHCLFWSIHYTNFQAQKIKSIKTIKIMKMIKLIKLIKISTTGLANIKVESDRGPWYEFGRSLLLQFTHFSPIGDPGPTQKLPVQSTLKPPVGKEVLFVWPCSDAHPFDAF